MKRLSLLLIVALLSVATWAQTALHWSVGSGNNEVANIDWIGFTVPTTDDNGQTITEVPLHNIQLCTRTGGGTTSYMVISSEKSITNGRVTISENAPAPVDGSFVMYTFKDVKLTAGKTYYMYFTLSNTDIKSCKQRVALSKPATTYEPGITGATGDLGKQWEPYFKASSVPPANTQWSVGNGNTNVCNATWIGITVPVIDDEGNQATYVPLNEIRLCTRTGGAEKTAYMVVSASKDISKSIAVSDNAPVPQNANFAKYTFSDVYLKAGATYYLYFSESKEKLTSCGQRIALSSTTGNYTSKINAGGEKTWVPYLTVNRTTIPPVLSKKYGEKWLRISNCNDTGYAWCAPSNGNVASEATDESAEHELFCLVGNNTDGFDIYNKALGEQYKLTASALPAEGATASWTTGNAAKWFFNTSQAESTDKPGLGITTNVEGNMSLNLWANKAGDMKFYKVSGAGSRWTFTRLNPDPIKIKYAVTGETKYPETNTRIGEFKILYEGSTKTVTLSKNLNGTGLNFYPQYGEVSMDLFTYRGWKGSIDKGDYTTINVTADTESDYQYLWYHNNPPYRIPAIATRKDGKLLAINDYRPCGGDIGNGRVDLVKRIGSPDGSTWAQGETIIEGNGKDKWNGNDGFGDPALCIDRETGRVLLMCVTGHVLAPNGTRNNSGRFARFYSEDGGETFHNAVEGSDSIYDDVTELIYGLWDTDAYKAGDKTNTDEYTAQNLFIGSGRIFQSSKIKVGDYYRIYIAMWSKDRHNRVAYSDDFGMTWHILGTRKDMPFANFGNADEPKCEELPNGDVIMSSRKPNGRYYNIYTYTDAAKGEGSWGTGTAASFAAPSDWNGTNGEIMTFKVLDTSGELHNIVLQSLPTGLNTTTGDVRRNVGFFFKDITSSTSYKKDGKNDAPTFAKQGWERGLMVSDAQGSAYSTFSLQRDGRIAFFYEETPGGYSMVYVPLSISDITNGKYVKIVGDAEFIYDKAHSVGVAPHEASASDDCMLTLNFESQAADITGMSFDIEMPDCLTRTKAGNTDKAFDIADNSRMTAADHSVTVNGTRVNVTATATDDSKLIKGTDGKLLNLYYTVKAGAADGLYPVKVKNITMTNAKGEVLDMAPVTSYIKVGNPQNATLALDGHVPAYVGSKLAAETAIATLDMSKVISVAGSFAVVDRRSLIMPKADVTLEQATYSRKMANAWGTVCLPFAVESNTEVQYYELSEVTASYMTFSPVARVEAGVPAVCKRLGTAETQVLAITADNAPLAKAATDKAQQIGGTEWTLKGSFCNQTIAPESASNSIYYIASNQFLFANEQFPVPAFRAWFETPVKANAAQLLAIKTDGDMVTGINLIENADGTVKVIYGLDGRRMNKETKGAQIINSKKVIVK